MRDGVASVCVPYGQPDRFASNVAYSRSVVGLLCNAFRVPVRPAGKRKAVRFRVPFAFLVPSRCVPSKARNLYKVKRATTNVATAICWGLRLPRPPYVGVILGCEHRRPTAHVYTHKCADRAMGGAKSLADAVASPIPKCARALEGGL